MKRLIYQVLIWLLLIIPLACQSNSNYHLVARVIDGDTIVLKGGTRVRYIGIDTPETKHPYKGVEYFGKEASEGNRKLVEGKKVRLEYDVQRTDKYDRTLAYVYLEDGTFVNAGLVENGFARVSTYPPNVKYQELFRELEQKARDSEKGLWSPDVERKELGIPDPPKSEVRYDSSSAKEEPEEVIVYITKTGSKYHRAGCRHLRKSCIPISLKEAKKWYGPCRVCNPPME